MYRYSQIVQPNRWIGSWRIMANLQGMIFILLLLVLVWFLIYFMKQNQFWNRLLQKVRLYLHIFKFTSFSKSNFQSTYNKNYDTKENEMRLTIFKTNAAHIIEHNKRFKDGEESYSLGITQFVDQKPEERPRGKLPMPNA